MYKKGINITDYIILYVDIHLFPNRSEKLG